MLNRIEMLAADHESVKALFQSCEETAPGLKRKLLVSELCKSLQIHAALEEEIFYPAVREHVGSEAADLVQEAYSDHAGVKALTRELEHLNQHAPNFMEQLHRLKERVVEHAEKEEIRIFPLAQARLPLRHLTLDMDARRTQLMMTTVPPSTLGILGIALIGLGLLWMLRRGIRR
jgi:hemerythrin superfamily protein